MGIRWGLGFGPIRISGPFGFPAPTPGGIAFVVVAGVIIRIVEPLFNAFLSASVFVFSFGGADETYSLLVFALLFYVFGCIASAIQIRGLRAILMAAPGPAVFALFWNRTPLVNPDLARLDRTAAQEIFGSTLIAFAAASDWLIAIALSILTSIAAILIILRFTVRPRQRSATT